MDNSAQLERQRIIQLLRDEQNIVDNQMAEMLIERLINRINAGLLVSHGQQPLMSAIYVLSKPGGDDNDELLGVSQDIEVLKNVAINDHAKHRQSEKDSLSWGEPFEDGSIEGGGWYANFRIRKVSSF